MINDTELREEWMEDMRQEAREEEYMDNILRQDYEVLEEHITDAVYDDLEEALRIVRSTLDEYGWDFEDPKEVLHEIIDNI